jgi:hypothetical protein
MTKEPMDKMTSLLGFIPEVSVEKTITSLDLESNFER